MIVSFLLECENTPTPRGSAHPLTYLSVWIVLADLGVLSQAILIMKLVDTKCTSKGWVDNPFWMILHMLGNLFFELAGKLANVANKISTLMKVLHMSG